LKFRADNSRELCSFTRVKTQWLRRRSHTITAYKSAPSTR